MTSPLRREATRGALTNYEQNRGRSDYMATTAREIRPLPVIDTSDIQAERFNELLACVQALEATVARLKACAGRCQCMNCVVIGV